MSSTTTKSMSVQITEPATITTTTTTTTTTTNAFDGTIPSSSAHTTTSSSHNNNNMKNVRKGSNASTISSHRSATTTTSNGNKTALSVAAASISTTLPICDSRLPHKKRKESNEEQSMKGGTVGDRKNSHDSSSLKSSSLYPDLGLRKTASMGTITSSSNHFMKLRKASYDTNSVSFNSIPLPLPSLDGSIDKLSASSSARERDRSVQQGSATAATATATTTTTTTTTRKLSSDIQSKQQFMNSDQVAQGVGQGSTGGDPLSGSVQNESTKQQGQHHSFPAPRATNRDTTSVHNPSQSSLKKDISGITADDNSSQDETFASSGHRLLMEAIMLTNGGGSTIGDVGDLIAGGSNSSKTPIETLPSSSIPAVKPSNFPYRERLDSTASLFRYSNFFGNRDRLESWGGMSDLSVGPATSDSVLATAVIAATNLQNGLLFEDPDHDDEPDHLPALQMSASYSQDDHKFGAIPTNISVQPGRDRLGSIASIGEFSVTNAPLNVDGVDVPGADLQAFVAAAMASVGDQLIEVACAMEELTGESMTSEDFKREFPDGADCSVVSPMIGAISDVPGGRRPRAWSTSSGIPVDIAAVNAAVEAAYSVALEPPAVQSSEGKSKPSSRMMMKRSLPLKRRRNDGTANVESSDSTISEDLNTKTPSNGKSSKKRPRKSEGINSQNSSKKTSTKNRPPLKKRPLEKPSKPVKSRTPASECSMDAMKTPIASNRTVAEPVVSELSITPSIVLSIDNDNPSSQNVNNGGDGGASGQANQKWEKMFECMLQFAAQRKDEETKGMTDGEKEVWVWDGNVPTNHKTDDGMALGRWVNNQRSAKAKGTLKDDREQRLIDAGLKWSVLASNSWNEMLEELSIYIKEQHQQGKVWDGNVPTNYQIKSRPNGGFNGEDKNLGRWVNRQRSLYQSGKLRKERKVLLEKVGLKWSMLATTSWDGMYDTLKEYVDQQIKKLGGEKWDGNVPANYRTNDNPSRALGRWVNRQRSAFAKKKLKKEFVDKLNDLGLKWSVHHRPGEMDENYDGEFDDGCDDEFADPVETPDKGLSTESIEKNDKAKVTGTSDEIAAV